MVIYANERSRYSSVTIELHSAVKEGQAIIRLPDLTKMEAKVLVNESKIELLELDSHAQLKIGDRMFRGTVKSIANQPERGSFGSDVKEYATIVSIEGEAAGLKPGMTAEVEILVDEFEDVLTVPVSAVVEKRGKYFCWVGAGEEKPEQRELIVIGTNDRKMAISDGVKVGDKVILNPRATVPEAREEAKKPDEKDGAGGESDGDWGGRKSGGDRESGGRKPGERPQGGAKASPAGGPSSGGSGASGRPAGGSGQKPYEDKNGDGLITKDEVSGPMVNYFDKLDENGDGSIDQAEFKKAADRRKSSGGPR
jgi:HlyD family secretion protein